MRWNFFFFEVLHNWNYLRNLVVLRYVCNCYVCDKYLVDFEVQRKTWSVHKNRNLLKAMMLVLPDGYIWHTEACFYANGANNDAKILNAMLSETKVPSLKSALKAGDAMLLDRGFRDSSQKLTEAGIKNFMPHFMDKNGKQLTCEQANESRKVTMGRFVVETSNGRIKNVFRLFIFFNCLKSLKIKINK